MSGARCEAISVRSLSGCEVSALVQLIFDEALEESQEIVASLVGAQRHFDVGAPTTPELRSSAEAVLAGMHYFPARGDRRLFLLDVGEKRGAVESA